MTDLNAAALRHLLFAFAAAHPRRTILIAFVAGMALALLAVAWL
jgi:hypothetical protein